ncbi:MAG TPA: DMT family transporter [Burkholderiales bacterium]|nr:DMT family transporter [Burkholderiales bacterium]
MTAGLPVALRGALWMVGALVSFSIMAVSVRELLHSMGSFEILFIRSFMSLAILLLLLPRRLASLRTRHFGLHVLRNAFHFGGQYAWVYAISILPLATVFAIEFTMPVWAALLAMLFLGERLNQGRVVMLALGVAGVFVMLRPGVAVIQPAALVMLLGAFAYASTMIATKRLSGHDSAFAILFYMAVIQLPFGLVPALPQWVWPGLGDLPWVIALGVVGLSAHYCMTRAFRIADAMVVVPIDFLRLPLIAVVGMLFYGERIELPFVLGAAVIFAGTFYSIRRESMGRLEPSRGS